MAERHFDLIVFDWDGTLFDSTAMIARCIQDACVDLGLPMPSLDAASYVIGLGLQDALMHAAPSLPRERYRELALRYRHHYQARQHELVLFTGAFDLLHDDRSALLASVGLALDWADTQAAHADQAGLFDFGDSHAASTHEPALVAAAAWDVKERLTQEKTALGFYLSGHLFEQSEDEVRLFCRTRIADLVDSREPQLLAGIASDMRVINGQRGRVMIFKLDDRSEVIEAVAGEELIDANRELLKEDELLIVQGRVKLDRFNGGLRLDVAQVWDLAAARARFGRYLAVSVNGIPLPLRDLLRQWPARRLSTEQGDLEQGLGVRLKLQRPDATADLDLGDEARFWPCDEALARWRSVAHQGQASIVYG